MSGSRAPRQKGILSLWSASLLLHFASDFLIFAKIPHCQLGSKQNNIGFPREPAFTYPSVRRKN